MGAIAIFVVAIPVSFGFSNPSRKAQAAAVWAQGPSVHGAGRPRESRAFAAYRRSFKFVFIPLFIGQPGSEQPNPNSAAS
jgi:hypothetical protein